jgi:hypothetical protein
MSEVETPSIDELATLKGKADRLGIDYHPNIGVDKLRERVNEAMSDEPKVEAPAEPKAMTSGAKKAAARKEATKLVRCRVTCNNPNKQSWQGEIFTVSTTKLGKFTKYVPFDTVWHIPNILLEGIRGRYFQSHYIEKHVMGTPVTKQRRAREFNIEILPDLTQEELDDLIQRNKMTDAADKD